MPLVAYAHHRCNERRGAIILYREIGNTLVHQQAKMLKEYTYELSRDMPYFMYSHTVDLFMNLFVFLFSLLISFILQ